ncbi:MAG: FtsW/RodA/SpoVE family cell cycle protein [Muribaculaceae bacterium]|nr:FtsW/RodA/SpoVE family cell cycle protein [Muribaculaceae bacterium]
MVAASLILVLLYISMRNNLSDDFDAINQNKKIGQTVVLNNKTNPDAVAKVLVNNNIVDKNEAQFIASQLEMLLKKNGTPDDLEDLKKNRWKASQSDVEASDSKFHKDKLARILEELEQTGDFEKKDASVTASEVTVPGNGDEQLSVKIVDKSNGETFGTPCSGVLVRLKQHFVPQGQDLDSIVKMGGHLVQDSVLAYAKTDKDGVAVFKGLNDSCSYSVLPISKGHKYGNAQGTLHGNMEQFRSSHGFFYKLMSCFMKKDCNFTQLPLGVPLFSNQALSDLKQNNVLIVREPSDYNSIFSGCFFGIMVLWWGLFMFTKLKRPVDDTLLATLMLLTGVSILVMFALNSPLTSTLNGVETTIGVGVGIVLAFLMQTFDVVSFYQGRARVLGNNVPFDILSEKSKFFSDQKGFIYLIISLVLSLLLFVPGLGHEIGGMKVNLKLPGFMFQPSEIAKYLIVMFMAAYFCQNAETITRYSERGNFSLVLGKLRNLGFIAVGMMVILLLYVTLGDMGPAMVVLFTFILLYSIIKSRLELKGLNASERLNAVFTCDLALLLGGAISYGVLLWLFSLADVIWIAPVVWFVGWIGYFYVKRRQFVETPIMFNIIVTVFVMSSVLASNSNDHGVLSRLGERTDMCTNTWGRMGLDAATTDTVATTNGQIAHGLWALSTGGTLGQGLGNGDSGFVPAYHTDMILESVGEQMGFAGLLLLMLAYIILLHRSITVGYRAKHPFAMFLCTGIAIATAVQLFIIALGSTGIIPLTGITVPLLSFGKVSMILNIAAFGVVLSISAHNKKETAAATNAGGETAVKYQYTLGILNLTFCSLMLLVLGTFFNYAVISRDKTLIRPLYVKTTEGGSIIEYNPRIALLSRKLPMGDITDRNGIILATSDPTKLGEDKNREAYAMCDLSVDTTKRQTRHYPFAEHLFFMVGDYNSRLMFSSPYSFMAEHRYLDSIRGFDNRMYDKAGKEVRINLPRYEAADNTDAGRFTGNKIEHKSQDGIVLRDYTALLPYLKAGLKSQRVKDLIAGKEDNSFGEKIVPKDLQLTVDAVLQTRLQQRIKDHVKNTDKYRQKGFERVRISAVVIDADKGDLLASANYPLPDYDVLSNLPENYRHYEDRIDKTAADFKPFTDMDLGLSFASPPGSSAKVISAMSGLMMLGDEAASKVYNVNGDQKVGAEPVGTVSMERAIVESSNCYFINLVNQYNTYPALDSLYSKLGVYIKGAPSYRFLYDDKAPFSWRKDFLNVVNETPGATSAYNTYINSYSKHTLKDPKMNKHHAWLMQWGQGDMNATPAVMARAAATVVNGGYMPVTRYLAGEQVKRVNIVGAHAGSLRLLKEYMRTGANSSGHGDIRNQNVGGKTGTAERYIKEFKGKGTMVNNDGWFMCYYEGTNHRYGIAVRVERVPGRTYAAGVAAPIVRDVVLQSLAESNYLN